MTDTSRQVIEEIISSTDSSFSTRNRVLGNTEMKNISINIFRTLKNHAVLYGKDYSYFEAVNVWGSFMHVAHGVLMRNMMKLRGRRNVLYVHNFAEASGDDDPAFYDTIGQFQPLNVNRVLAPAISNHLNYSDLNFYPVYSGTDTNFTKAVFDEAGLTSVSATGQYRLGDNIVLSNIPEGVTFDAVYFHGIERAEDRLYSIEEIRQDFSAYITDNCQFYDYYEQQAAREAMLNASTSDFEVEARWSSTPRNNKEIFEYAFRAVAPTGDVDATVATARELQVDIKEQYVENVKFLHGQAKNLGDKILKVF